MENLISEILESYPVLAPAFFLILRALAIVIPPIPGVIFDVVSLTVFGWLWGLILAEAGIMLGASIAFFISRYFREPVVSRFLSLKKLTEWESTLSEQRKFWALVLIRLPTNALFDYISYAAGLTRIGFLKFFFATLLGNIPGLFLFYFFGGYL